MKNIFACPHCHAVLNPNVKILLKMSFKGGQGLILLSPQPGNFKFICDDSLRNAIKQGATVEFTCPVCTKSLTSERSKKLATLNIHTPGGGERQVEFSRIYGTYATYIFDGDEVTAYGDDAEGFSPPNFFGA